MKNVYKDRKYSVVSYDTKWPAQFEMYANKIRNIFGPEVQIEHISSTSVPGMSGKPCIDVLVVVDMKIVESHTQELLTAGFVDAGEFVMKGSHLFRVMDGNEPIANIHFFPKGHTHNTQMIGVRNYLRSHPEEVKAYSEIKNELYSKYIDDYSSYRKEKDKYMYDLIKRSSV